MVVLVRIRRNEQLEPYNLIFCESLNPHLRGEASLFEWGKIKTTRNVVFTARCISQHFQQMIQINIYRKLSKIYTYTVFTHLSEK